MRSRKAGRRLFETACCAPYVTSMALRSFRPHAAHPLSNCFAICPTSIWGTTVSPFKGKQLEDSLNMTGAARSAAPAFNIVLPPLNCVDSKNAPSGRATGHVESSCAGGFATQKPQNISNPPRFARPKFNARPLRGQRRNR